jgi:hypothetical protein
MGLLKGEVFMLSEISKQAINHLVYQTLYLAHLGCPKLDHPHAMGFPYEDLTQFINGLDNATDEEKQYVKEVIREELEQGVYLGDKFKQVNEFVEKLIYLFFDTKDFNLDSVIRLQEIWFGKTVMDEIVRVVGNDIMDRNDEAFRLLKDS